MRICRLCVLVNIDQLPESRILFFELLRTPGYFAEAQAQLVCYLPLAHPLVDKAGQRPPGGNLCQLVGSKETLQEIADQSGIIRPRHRLGKLPKRLVVDTQLLSHSINTIPPDFAWVKFLYIETRKRGQVWVNLYEYDIIPAEEVMKKLVPNDFNVPEILETDQLRLRMLTVQDVVKDYEAVMTSIGHLQKTKPFGPGHDWPTTSLTFEQDLIDLGWHQKEFQNRSSFAYTVMDLEETRCLGCVYIYPSRHPGFDAIIILWVRQSEVENGLDDHLFETVKKWIDEAWPFESPGFPGRTISWNAWKEQIKEE